MEGGCVEDKEKFESIFSENIAKVTMKCSYIFSKVFVQDFKMYKLFSEINEIILI